ncbi:hypothetical protein ASF72_18980 [Arthrobacter sp. Leaf141]|nr:hypothetical protein ASF72_18980 [Arthrobacter sp. Leaf141]
MSNGREARNPGQAPAVKHQQLIVTLYGLYCREPGSALPVAALVALLGDLGFDPPGVRSAVSRLKAKGVLQSTRASGAAAYELGGSLQAVFADGDQRIFSERREPATDDWLLAVFSVPEAQRHLRHQLRALLTGLGFGTVSPGVWIASAGVADRARHLITERGLAEFVEFFRGDFLTNGDISAKVPIWWDLASIDSLMGEFLEYYGDAAQLWGSRLEGLSGTPSDAAADINREAFRYYVPMLTLWRRLPYRDPNLPLHYLPKDWKEPAARRAFVRTHALLSPLAAIHARQVISA